MPVDPEGVPLTKSSAIKRDENVGKGIKQCCFIIYSREVTTACHAVTTVN